MKFIFSYRNTLTAVNTAICTSFMKLATDRKYVFVIKIDYGIILRKNDSTYGKIVCLGFFRSYGKITVLQKKCL